MIPEARTLTHEELEAFAPPSDLKRGLKDPKTAICLLPLLKLPSCLYPQPKSRLHPPVFRLGYAVPIEWAADYAKKYGLVKPPYQPEKDYEDDDVSEEDSDAYAPVEKAPSTEETRWVQRCSVDVDLQDVINHINANSGTVSLKVTREHFFPLPSLETSRVYYWLISIGSNYRKLPTRDDLIKLHKYLETGEFPAWYLDMWKHGWEGHRVERKPSSKLKKKV